MAPSNHPIRQSSQHSQLTAGVRNSNFERSQLLMNVSVYVLLFDIICKFGHFLRGTISGNWGYQIVWVSTSPFLFTFTRFRVTAAISYQHVNDHCWPLLQKKVDDQHKMEPRLRPMARSPKEKMKTP